GAGAGSNAIAANFPGPGRFARSTVAWTPITGAGFLPAALHGNRSLTHGWPATAPQIESPGAHSPWAQWSLIVQGSCTLHDVVGSATRSAGQAPLSPSHDSATSQTVLTAGRQTWPAGRSVQSGAQHSVPGTLPSHISPGSTRPLPQRYPPTGAHV